MKPDDPALPVRSDAVPLAADGSVASPCISVCRMDPVAGLCVGCLRTLDEIAAWARLDARARRAVWQAIGERAASAAAGPRDAG